MLQALLIWVVFATFLTPTSSQSCIKANESQCNNANFIPGSNLAGEGFDITTMERKGAFVIDMSSWLKKDKTCTLCENPYMGGVKQKLPVSVVDWRPSQKCSMKVSSSVYHSSESLFNSSTSSIENRWQQDLNLVTPKVQGSVMMAGTNSKLAKYSMQKTKKDKFSFTSQIVKCGYYNYRVLKHPVISHDLNEEFKSLPQRYDKCTKHLYFKLIDMFGTHYIKKVTLGGEIRSVTSIKECQASLQGLSVDEVKSCLDLEASVSMGIGSDMQNEAYHCKQAKKKYLNERSFSSTFSDRETNVLGGKTENVDLLFSSNTNPKAYKQWVSSLPAHPDVLSYSLMPLDDLLPRKSSIQAHLRNAIKDYILQRALILNCTSPCKTGVRTNPKEPCSCSCHNNPGVALNCCPTQKGFAHVTVTIIKATGLYGDYIGQTDGYVKILLNGKHPRGKTSMIPNNDPIWNSDFYLETVDLSKFKSVKLEVWDEDSWSDDDLLGGCSVPLKSGINNNICPLNHGLLYYKVQVNCITSLTGPSCMQYKPSPMDSQLPKEYVSRNAYPIPRNMLLEMGVLLNERIACFNMSNIRKAEGFEL
ncbi:perforin-1-like [Silurus meridionalis]|uniref:perforin-1-like n=1 Tax=Silurus meridionalis TaxID=175797 RepID=UPI001EEA31D8|nr:perforin-1-like [Silurus meridionalis]